MKNKVFILIASLLLISMSLFAQGANELTGNDYIVRVESIDNIDGGISILGVQDDLEEMIFNVEGGVDGLKLGDIILVKTNGITTRSIPAMATALEVSIINEFVEMGVYKYDEPVVDDVLMRKEVRVLDAFVEDTMSFLVQDENGEIYVVNTDEKTLTDTDLISIKPGYVIAVQDNGVMSLTLPGETYALSIMVVSELSIEEKFNYTFGFESISTFVSQGMIIKPSPFAKAVLDFESGEFALTVDEINASIKEVGTVENSVTPEDALEEFMPSLEAVANYELSDSLIDKFSYAIGIYIVSEYCNQGFDFIANDFAYGVLDALYSLEGDYTAEERMQILQDYIIYFQAKLAEEQSAIANNNLALAQEFLAENAKKEGVITTASGLQYLVVEEGQGDKPNENSNCILNYVLSDIEGNVKDMGNNSNLNIGQTVPGFKEAVTNMNVGSSIIAYVHPDLGYGLNATPDIGQNSLLIFQIQLLDIVE